MDNCRHNEIALARVFDGFSASCQKCSRTEVRVEMYAALAAVAGTLDYEVPVLYRPESDGLWVRRDMPPAAGQGRRGPIEF